MEEHHINTVTSDKDSIFILYGHVTAWNDNLMIPLYSADITLPNFLRKSEMGIWQRPLEDLTVNSMRLTRPPKKRSTERALGEVNDIRDSAGSQELRVNDKRKPRIFFP